MRLGSWKCFLEKFWKGGRFKGFVGRADWDGLYARIWYFSVGVGAFWIAITVSSANPTFLLDLIHCMEHSQCGRACCHRRIRPSGCGEEHAFPTLGVFSTLRKWWTTDDAVLL